MTIAFYVSAHGFGHFVREAEVIKELPPEIPVLLRSGIAPWFAAQELAGRPYELAAASFDCGTLGPDSTRTDAARTFARALEMERENEAALEVEVAFLKSRNVRLVVSDITPFALRAARAASIPSILVTNFTWTEIYGGLIDQCRFAGDAETAAHGETVLDRIRAQYAEGDLLLIPGMALPMAACRRQREVPIIARRGSDKRAEICATLGLDPARPIYLVYLGHAGYEGLRWDRLNAIPEAQFFAFGGAAHPNVAALPEGRFNHADAVASCDAVVGKLGYSLCAECVATHRALVFPPRPGFAESSALEQAMNGYGLGVGLSEEAFRNVDWAAALEKARIKSASGSAIRCNGAEVCAGLLARVWHGDAIEQI